MSSGIGFMDATLSIFAIEKVGRLDKLLHTSFFDLYKYSSYYCQLITVILLKHMCSLMANERLA